MKKMSTTVLSWGVFLTVLLFASCAKDGATGPAGPAGPQGTNGAAGTAGVAGPKGDTGTANVIYSAWLDATFRVDTTSLPDSLWFTQINAPKLTAAIVNSGEIKVYMNLGSSTNPLVVPLPYFDGGVIVQPYFATGGIEVDANINLSTRTSSTGAKSLQYRYILIPGGANARQATSTVDWNNYASVQKYLNLMD